MSVRCECFKLCNEIIALPFRKQIYTLLHDLNYGKGPGSINDRSHFGYLARHYHTQIIGYLLIDRTRNAINATPLMMKVPDLTDDEREILLKAHEIINGTNQNIIEAYFAKLPKYSLSIDPYNIYNMGLGHKDISDIIDINIYDGIISSFADTVAIKNITTLPYEQIEKIAATMDMKGLIGEFTKRIKQSGVHRSPSDFEELRFMRPKNISEDFSEKIIFNTLSLSAMLTTIDQLIYQSFFNDKMVILDENNIINIIEHNNHLVSEGFTILVQPNGFEIGTDVGDIVLMKLSNEYIKVDQLGVVEGVNLKFSQDEGTTLLLKIRMIDDNLDPYKITKMRPV